MGKDGDLEGWNRAEYSLRRVNAEVERGIRQGYPQLESCAWEEELEQTSEKTVLPEQQFKEFYLNTRPAVEKPLAEAKICDVVTFGSYEQDGDVGNGKEVIKWYVCDQEGDVRKWLNEEFFGNAFSEAEQAKILTTQIKNDYGGDTEDRVWLLSFSEYIDYFGVQNRRPMGVKETWNEIAQRATDDCHLMSHPTQAAISKGL